MAERSKAEMEFIDQRTRQLMVKWCDYAIRNQGAIPDLDSVRDLKGAMLDAVLKVCQKLEMHRDYFDHAVKKGWLGVAKKRRRRINASGWAVAKAFLKR